MMLPTAPPRQQRHPPLTKRTGRSAQYASKAPVPKKTPPRYRRITDGTHVRTPPNNRGPIVGAHADLADIANSAYPTDSAPSGLTLIACLSKQLSPPTPQQLPHKQSPASCTSLSTHTVGLPLEWKLVFRLL
jgi:hypothetical protein